MATTMERLFELSFTTSLPMGLIAMRLGAACVFGFLIGIDREMRQRPAGLRTHMLTALAAAVFTIITFEFVSLMGGKADGTQLDPIRIVESVTSGVAFLAAGTIITHRGDIRGLTTGAGMWLAGAVGLACGAGFLTLALLGTAFALIILVPLRFLEVGISKELPGRMKAKMDEAAND